MLTEAGSVAVFPALSTAVPRTNWFCPSVVTVVFPVPPAAPSQVAMPEAVELLEAFGGSPQVKLTVTSLLFQPLAFAGGA